MTHTLLSDPVSRLINNQSLLSANHSQLDAIIEAIKEQVYLNNLSNMSSNKSDLETLTENLADISNDLYLVLNPRSGNLNEDILRTLYNQLTEACKNFISDQEHFDRAITNTIAEAQANTEDRAETDRLLQLDQTPSFPPFNI